MQTIKIKEIIPSLTEKSPTVIITEDGSKMSSFHTSLKSLKVGDVIEVDPEIKKGYVNIKDWKLLESSDEQRIPTDKPKPSGFEELKIKSEDRHAAMNVILQLILANKDIVTQELKEKFLNAIDEMITVKTSLSEQLARMPHVAAKPEPESEYQGKFKNVGELFAACLNEGIGRKEVLAHLNIPERDVPKIKPDDAWETIYDQLIKPRKEANI